LALHFPENAMRLIPLLLLPLLAALPAAADTVVLPAAADTTIYENFDDSGNGGGEWFFAGITNTAAIRRGLIRFDLSVLPPGTQIQGVALRLGLSRGNGTGPQVGLHRVTQAWTEGGKNSEGQEGAPELAIAGDATWRFRSFPTLEWTNLGGDFAATPSASLTVPSPVPNVVTFHTWPSTAALVADVQGWVDAPATNFGWMLKLANEGPGRKSRRFQSRTNTDAPQLTVTFVAQPMFADGFESGDTSGWSLTEP
jgi:hypothetical protein